MAEQRTVVCSHDCPDACSVRVGVEDGRITSVGGDPDHPVTQGFLCGKVNRYAERVYSPRRLLYPLRRTGAKGEGRFERISWDEALDTIAERFAAVREQHGAEAILPYSYGGTIGHVGFFAGHRLFHALGASRLARTICIGSATEGMRMTMGSDVHTDIEEAADAELILLWGLNAVATHIHFMPIVKRARARGAKLVVIDPYRTATARQADWYVQPRPGTDAALALGMMHVLLAEGLHEPAFIERYTTGFDALREACAAYTPEHTEAVTGVPAAEVAALARAYGGTRRAFLRLGLGISRHGNGGMTVRTIGCLPALTGAWEAPGGGFHCYGWAAMRLNLRALAHPRPGDPPARTVNMVRLGEALTELSDPPVQALYVYNANPAAIAPEQSRVVAGLRREDLFCVVHEQMHTDTTDYADIVLPATTFMEHDELNSGYGHDYIQLSRAAIPPQGEARDNLSTFRALARRLGITDPVLERSFDGVVELLLDKEDAPQGAEREALWAGRPVKARNPEAPWRTRLRTPSGRFELFSSRMEAQGLPGAPAFVPSEEGHTDNALRRRYPLQLVAPPAQHFLNTSFGDTEASRRLMREPRLKLHPADAAARGLSEGDTCRAFNDRGDSFLTVEVTEDVRPGVVVAESVWWPKLLRERKGINRLTSAELTDLGGCARFHDGLVQVEPAEGPARVG